MKCTNDTDKDDHLAKGRVANNLVREMAYYTKAFAKFGARDPVVTWPTASSPHYALRYELPFATTDDFDEINAYAMTFTDLGTKNGLVAEAALHIDTVTQACTLSLKAEPATGQIMLYEPLETSGTGPQPSYDPERKRYNEMARIIHLMARGRKWGLCW